MRAAAVCCAVLLLGQLGCGGDDPEGPEVPESVTVEILLTSWVLDDPDFRRDSLHIWRNLGEIIHSETIPAVGDVIFRYDVPCDRDGTLATWNLNYFVTWIGGGEINTSCRGGFAVVGFLECTESRQTISEFLHDGAWCTPPAS